MRLLSLTLFLRPCTHSISHFFPRPPFLLYLFPGMILKWLRSARSTRRSWTLCSAKPRCRPVPAPPPVVLTGQATSRLPATATTTGATTAAVGVPWCRSATPQALTAASTVGTTTRWSRTGTRPARSARAPLPATSLPRGPQPPSPATAEAAAASPSRRASCRP